MKARRILRWKWCPHPEHINVSRTRPADRSWIPLFASALVLSLLAFQGIKMWAPSALNTPFPNTYGSFAAVQPALETPAEATPAAQLTTVVSTEHVTVQLVFPEFADPGETITISARTTAKSSGKVISLTIEVFSYIDKQLVKATSETVVKDKNVRSGDAWQTSLLSVVPTSTQRSAMIGTVTEVWEETLTYYYGPYYYGPYYRWPGYPYSPPYPCDQNVCYYNYYVYEPSYVVTQKSLQQTVPLTYVLATTPEYEELQKKHEQLRKDYDELVAKHNELASKYDSLRGDYDQTVSKYNKLQSDYNSTIQELSNYRLATYILILVVVALGIAVLFITLRRQRPREAENR